MVPKILPLCFLIMALLRIALRDEMIRVSRPGCFLVSGGALLTHVSFSLQFRYNTCFPWSAERVECITAGHILRNLWSSLMYLACSLRYAQRNIWASVVASQLSCLICTAQIATYSWCFGASLSLMVFDIFTTCFRGSTRISDVTNWRWISPRANHFTLKHCIGLRTSKFDLVSKKPSLFKLIIWRCESLSCPLEPVGPHAPYTI